METLQPVSEQEWERQKDVLKGMYCTEKFPLQSRKGEENAPGVVELMKERHGFSASPSQYELQFKKWGFTKNLKRGEWVALISQYDRLCQTKDEVRITLSGAVLSKNKIDRARRRYRPQHSRTRSVSYKDGTLPASRQAHVEFLDEAGEWRKYAEPQAEASNAMVLHKSSHSVGLTSLLNGDLEDQDILEAQHTGLHTLRTEEAMGSFTFSHDPDPLDRPLSPLFNLDEFLHNPIFSVDNGVFSSLPSASGIPNGLLNHPTFFFEPSEDSPIRTNVPIENDHQHMVLRRAVSVPRGDGHLEAARSLIKSLVQHGKTTQWYKPATSTKTEIPDVEEIMESLESLLPETETTSRESSGLTLSMSNASSSSTLFKTLIYSFTNNFAGLRDVPRSSIMQLLREHHGIRTQLFEVIKNGKPGIAKPLADNLFRAAVEGCDADAVATIIHHTKCNPKIAIDPNEIACRFEGMDYTPIELAAKFRNTELVRTLVTSRADPNKTYKHDGFQKWEQGALALALGRWDNGSKSPYKPSPPGEPEPMKPDLLRLLLDCGAEVRMDLVQNAMRPGPVNAAVAEELISRIPASDHQICFKSEWILVSAIHYLENIAANRIVRRIFLQCSESTDCGRCASEHPMTVEKMLCHAARRANLELTRFLAQHTTKLQSALAAAVRAASDELIHFLLDQGARVDAPVQSLNSQNNSGIPYYDVYDENGYDRPHHPSYKEYVITPIRTPLAEAIRSRNNYLISTFERLGALTRLSEKYHFHAAVFAAAEVGNNSYLKMVLGYASGFESRVDLTLALAVAIRNDETDTALILLDAGADHYYYNRLYGDLLVNALKRRNKRVVDSMLECHVQVRRAGYRLTDVSALEVAGSWCETEIIEDMVRLGAAIDFGMETTALGAAVRSRNTNLIDRLLDLGANPEAPLGTQDVITPLRAAVEIGDYDMVRFLIAKGASPADESAFAYAMSHDPVGYDLLLSEFRSRYPHGLKGFGGDLLAKAIEQDSQLLIDSLLSAGADVNSWNYASVSSAQAGSHDRTRREQMRVLGIAIQHRNGRSHELVRKLLGRGAETDCIVHEYSFLDPQGGTVFLETPLLLAIKAKNLQLVSLLLEYGADINRPARRGLKRTPLQAACKTGSCRMVELLLQEGARVNDAAAQRYGGTALQMAAKTGSLKIAKLLLENGADPYLAKSKVDGRTAFEAAAENGCIDMLLLLWNAVLPLGFSEKECQSARDFAKKKGHRGCVDFIDFLSGGSSQSFLDG